MAILTGLGLSVACGFRLFIPLVVVGIAAQIGTLELAESFSNVMEIPEYHIEVFRAEGYLAGLKLQSFADCPYKDNLEHWSYKGWNEGHEMFRKIKERDDKRG